MIRASSARDVTRLLADLASDSGLRRESAIARLALVGDRAVERLLPLLAGETAAETRAGALRALEAIGHPRGLRPALALTADVSPAVVAAAIGVVRVHLLAPDSNNAAVALDRLAAIALDGSRSDRDRELALDALSDLPPDDVEPILRRLRDDSSAAVRERVSGDRGAVEGGRGRKAPPALEGGLPENPESSRALVVSAGPTATIGALHRLIDTLRARERAERTAARRVEWTLVRATLHQVLAARGSRVGVYDLRETFEAATAPVAVGFVAAAGTIGDASCLEPLAACWARSGGTRHDSWRRQLAVAFHEIVRREKLTRRHAVLKRVNARWPEAAAQLLHP